MKKSIYHLASIFSMLLILASCSNLFVEDEVDLSGTGGEMTSVRLVFPLLSRRTIAPEASDLEIETYAIRLSRRGYPDLVATADSAVTTGEAGFLMADIATGSWNVMVMGLNDDGLVIASGSDTVVAEAGMTKNASIVLAYDQTGGTGGVDISFTFPTGMFTDEENWNFLTSVEASLTYIDGSITALTTAIVPSGVPGIDKVVISGSDIKAGSPLLLVSFKDDYNGEVPARVSETVWVFRNVVTRLSRPLVVPRNPSYVELVDIEGSIYLDWSEVPYATGYTIYVREDVEDSEHVVLKELVEPELGDYYYNGDYAFDGYYDYEVSYELLNMLVPGDWLITVSASYGEDESDYSQGVEVSYSRAAEDWYASVSGYSLYWDAVPEATGYNIYLRDSPQNYVLVSALPLEGDTLQQYWDVDSRFYYYFYNDLYALPWDEGTYYLCISAIVGGHESDKLEVASSYFSSGGYFEGSGFFGSSAGS